MKKNKVIYWTSTGIVGAMMLFVGFSYLTNDEMKAAFVHLGFPGYFRIELAIAKIIGALALLIPFMRKGTKYIAYAGFAITFISAFVAHTSSGDPVSVAIKPVVFLGVLFVSFIYYRKHVAIRNVDSDIRSKEQLLHFQ